MTERRAIWRGEIKFASTTVPVKLYSTLEGQDVQFNLLHDHDKSRLRQQLFCELEQKAIERQDVAKGLEVSESSFIQVEQADLDELEPESSRAIEVQQFVPPQEVDARYYDRPYQLGPDGDEAGYALLASALAQSGKVGICQWVFRKRSYSGVLLSDGRRIELITLRTSGQVLPVSDLKLAHVKLDQRELKTAHYLVKELALRFDPSKYRNTFRKAVMELIEAKAKGGKWKKGKGKPPAPAGSGKLLEDLQASLAHARRGKAKA